MRLISLETMNFDYMHKNWIWKRGNQSKTVNFDNISQPVLSGAWSRFAGRVTLNNSSYPCYFWRKILSDSAPSNCGFLCVSSDKKHKKLGQNWSIRPIIWTKKVRQIWQTPMVQWITKLLTVIFFRSLSLKLKFANFTFFYAICLFGICLVF